MTATGVAAWAGDLGGGTRLTVLRVGAVRVDAGSLFGPVPRVLWEPIVGDDLDDQGRLVQALHAVLVETPALRVLVDTGLGEGVSARARAARAQEGPSILEALAVQGVDPASIDAVVLSHLHRDHAGGLLTRAGLPAFPRARIVAQRAEWRATLGGNARIADSANVGALERLREAGVAGWVEGDTEPLPGIAVLRSGGHTAGHQVVLVRSRGGTTVAYLGDLCGRRWNANPRWMSTFDDFPLETVVARAGVFARAVDEGWTVVLGHEPGSPVGRLERDRDRFRFVAG